MINELYQLTKAMEQANIVAEHTHPKYKPIPKVTKKAPCVQIILENGQIYKIKSLTAEQASEIRKYGTNQGTFPALNLAPLYRLTDELEKKKISELMDGKTAEFNVEEIRSFCRENNWGKKFRNKYRISMQEIPREMSELFFKTGIPFSSLQQLIGETDAFSDADHLHSALQEQVFALLEQKIEIRFLLQILFHLGKKEKDAEDDYGTLSVVMDCRQLIKDGCSTAADNFTNMLNKKLMEADEAAKDESGKMEVDAFGNMFMPLEEPMPTVKLAAGFEVSLRTMFRGQPCQSRYGRVENATYPISKEMRFKLQAALAWMSDEEHKEITWISIDKDEVLFAYPETLRQNKFSFVSFFKHPGNVKKEEENAAEKRRRNKGGFEAAAKVFVEELKKTKEPGTDPVSERIQYFVLRKLDKARTKVVYAYNISPGDIERRSEQWAAGCKNIPRFVFGNPWTLYPLEVSGVLNQIWRQDGKLSTDKFKPFPCYHGIQLLFEEEKGMVQRDLFLLVRNITNLAPYLGRAGISRQQYDKTDFIMLRELQKILALMGLFLYQLGIRKEKYMQEFPYLFGQLLQVSDALHEMYCRVVRDNDIPNTLVGSGMYIMGAEQPYKALGILGDRMNPYIAWAKTCVLKGVKVTEKERERVREYLSLYGNIAAQLKAVWSGQTRFNEEEKAQYFIGYLAELPKQKEAEETRIENQSENSENIQESNL